MVFFPFLVPHFMEPGLAVAHAAGRLAHLGALGTQFLGRLLQVAFFPQVLFPGAGLGKLLQFLCLFKGGIVSVIASQPAAFQVPDAVAQPVQQLPVMADQHKGLLLAKFFFQQPASRQVQVSGGFVQEQKPRAKGDAAQTHAGDLAPAARRPVLQFAHPKVPAALPGGFPRAQAKLGRIAQVAAAPYLPPVAGAAAGQHLQQCGFAAAVLSNQPDSVPGIDRQARNGKQRPVPQGNGHLHTFQQQFIHIVSHLHTRRQTGGKKRLFCPYKKARYLSMRR